MLTFIAYRMIPKPFSRLFFFLPPKWCLTLSIIIPSMLWQSISFYTHSIQFCYRFLTKPWRIYPSRFNQKLLRASRWRTNSNWEAYISHARSSDNYEGRPLKTIIDKEIIHVDIGAQFLLSLSIFQYFCNSYIK